MENYNLDNIIVINFEKITQAYPALIEFDDLDILQNMKTLEELEMYCSNATEENKILLQNTIKVENDIVSILDKKYLLFLDDKRLLPISCWKLARGFKKVKKFDKWEDLKIIATSQRESLHKLFYKLNSSSRIDKICFNEGTILKNTLYSALRLGKGIYFVENEKYPIKLVECQIRSFCQLMEEMGAKKITISYDLSSIKSKKINSELQSMAGDIGFEKKEIDKKEKHIRFDLQYPKATRFNLDEKSIIDSIKHGEFFLYSNNSCFSIEYKYVIASRCNHLITDYVTNFHISMASHRDYKMFGDLKGFLPIGKANLNIGYSTKHDNTITIKTRVEFYSPEDIRELLQSNVVSLDYNGFLLLMRFCKSLSDENFQSKGLNNIFGFLDRFVQSKTLSGEEKWIKAHDILNKTKSTFGIEYIRSILGRYFQQSSDISNLEIFLQVLTGEMFSNDKLGYSVKLSNDSSMYKIQTIKEYLMHEIKPTPYLLEQYNEALSPNSQEFESIYYMTLYRRFFKVGNYKDWDYLQYLITDIKQYTLTRDHPTLVIHESSWQLQNTTLSPGTTATATLKGMFGAILNNFSIGYPRQIFDEQMIPFIQQYFSSTINIDSIVKMLNYDNFKKKQINDLQKLDIFMNNKIKQYTETLGFIEKTYQWIENDMFSKLAQLVNDNASVYWVLKLQKMCLEKSPTQYELEKLFFHVVVPSSLDAARADWETFNPQHKKARVYDFYFRIISYNDDLPEITAPGLNNLTYACYWRNYLNGSPEIESARIYHIHEVVSRCILKYYFNNDYVEESAVNRVTLKTKIIQDIRSTSVKQTSWVNLLTTCIQMVNKTIPYADKKSIELIDLYEAMLN